MGERTPHLNPNARGVFFGLSAIHTKADCIRAVMEGVTFSQRDCMEVIKEMGAQFDEMLACGGGGSSPLWREMLADVYGIPVKTLASKEGPALGVAILAGVAAGIYPDVVSACREIVKSDKTTEPNEEHRVVYEKYYQLYREIYPQLVKQYDLLNAL